MKAKKKIIILSIIFGVIAALFIGFVMFPLFEGIKKDLAELINIKKELVISEGQAGKFEQFGDIYKKIEPDLNKIDRLFVDSEVPINLIEFWEKTADDCDLLITISPVFLKAEKNDPWNSIGFQISLTGSFFNFSKFLGKTESGPYLTEVQSLVLSKSEEREAGENGPEFYSDGVRANLLTKVFSK